ncbi:MAG: hypothetical protein QXL15_02780 [Candidatus Korarchaeota archaeon]
MGKYGVIALLIMVVVTYFLSRIHSLFPYGIILLSFTVIVDFTLLGYLIGDVFFSKKTATATPPKPHIMSVTTRAGTLPTNLDIDSAVEHLMAHADVARINASTLSTNTQTSVNKSVSATDEIKSEERKEMKQPNNTEQVSSRGNNIEPISSKAEQVETQKNKENTLPDTAVSKNITNTEKSPARSSSILESLLSALEEKLRTKKISLDTYEKLKKKYIEKYSEN